MSSPNDKKPSDEKLKRFTKSWIRRLPELAALEHNWQRNQAVKAGVKPSTWTICLLALAIVIFAMITLSDWLRMVGIKDEGTARAVCIGLASGWSTHLYFFIYRKRFARSIRQKINEFGTPVCMECGYLLTALTTPRCPECGTPYSGGCPDDPE